MLVCLVTFQPDSSDEIHGLGQVVVKLERLNVRRIGYRTRITRDFIEMHEGQLQASRRIGQGCKSPSGCPGS